VENKWLEPVLRSLNVELPPRDTFEEYLDLILPEIRQWSEDLEEEHFFSMEGGKPWLEVRDEENFHNSIVHFFNPKGEYLRSIDGNVIRGKWRLLEGSNKMLIETQEKASSMEMYELAYLDRYFFILKKHGNQARRRNYFVMGFEPAVQGLEWRDYVEALFNIYRNRKGSYRFVIYIIAIVIVIIVLLSIF
jgi:hypothetical protein